MYSRWSCANGETTMIERRAVWWLLVAPYNSPGSNDPGGDNNTRHSDRGDEEPLAPRQRINTRQSITTIS
jgi:hypothetical protein